MVACGVQTIGGPSGEKHLLAKCYWLRDSGLCIVVRVDCDCNWSKSLMERCRDYQEIPHVITLFDVFAHKHWHYLYSGLIAVLIRCGFKLFLNGLNTALNELMKWWGLGRFSNGSIIGRLEFWLWEYLVLISSPDMVLKLGAPRGLLMHRYIWWIPIPLFVLDTALL